MGKFLVTSLVLIMFLILMIFRLVGTGPNERSEHDTTFTLYYDRIMLSYLTKTNLTKERVKL